MSLCQVRLAAGHTKSRRLLVVAIKLASIVILGRMFRAIVTYEWMNAIKRRKWKIQSWLFIEPADAEIFQTKRDIDRNQSFMKRGKVNKVVDHTENRPVAGGGAGGARAPLKNVQTWIQFCYKSGIFLLKWTAVNGSLSFKVLSIKVRLCTVVPLCNLELCKWTKSYFCSTKNNQQL